MFHVHVLLHLRYRRVEPLVICILPLLPLCQVKNRTRIQTHLLHLLLQRSYRSLDRRQIKKMLIFTIRILKQLSLQTLTLGRRKYSHILDLVNFYINLFYFPFEQSLQTVQLRLPMTIQHIGYFLNNCR